MDEKEKTPNIKKLEKIAKNIRRKVVEMGYRAKCGHIAPGLSWTDIAVSLYYGGILKHDPKNPYWEGRDRFILSKGHGAMPLYAILAERGFFPKEKLETFVQPGTMLSCHADKMVPGIEITSGSLGLGLAQAAARSYALKIKKQDNKVYVLMGDGECQEGTVWEGAMFAGYGPNKLDHLVSIVDNNGFGAVKKLSQTLADIEPLGEKFKAFNFSVREINGHDFNEILTALREVPYESGKPSMIIAHTIKGKGVSYMENNPIWHHRAPSDEEYKIAMEELK